MLVGIVLRGSAFTFRSYDSEHDAAQRRWGRIFSIASVMTPVLLGSLSRRDRLGPGRWHAGGRIRRAVRGSLADSVCAVGGLAGAGAVRLSRGGVPDAGEPRPRAAEDFRARALAAGHRGLRRRRPGAAAVARWHGSAGARRTAGSPWAIPLHLATGASAIAALAALWFRRYRLARIAAAAPGLADLLGLGAGAVSLSAASELHHPRLRVAADDPPARGDRASRSGDSC